MMLLALTIATFALGAQALDCNNLDPAFVACFTKEGLSADGARPDQLLDACDKRDKVVSAYKCVKALANACTLLGKGVIPIEDEVNNILNIVCTNKDSLKKDCLKLARVKNDELQPCVMGKILSSGNLDLTKADCYAAKYGKICSSDPITACDAHSGAIWISTYDKIEARVCV